MLGGHKHGPSPTLNFGGDRPPVPPKSPPMLGDDVDKQGKGDDDDEDDDDDD